MTLRHFNVLFLCTGNSARSIMAEAIMNRKGFPHFTGYSAGSHPTGHVNPHALKQIVTAGLPVEGLRSKSWDEFGKPDAPEIHFVFTVCDREIDEPCPVWPGKPMNASGAYQTQQGLRARMSRFNAHISKPSEFLIAGSLCLFLCPWQRWKRMLSSGKSIGLAAAKRSESAYLNSDGTSNFGIKENTQRAGLGFVGLLLVATVWAVLWARKQPAVHSIWGEPSDQPLTLLWADTCKG